ncbi:MAG: hypothetical protein SNG69_02210 [Rikenellaceae bacterium]
MKKLLLILFLATLTISCNNSRKVTSDAKNAMKATMLEVVKNPKDAKIEDVTKMYANNSLCILHFTLTAKNGFGNDVTSKMEYVYILDNSKTYEAYHKIDNDAIFNSELELDKIKKGQIYENLDYDGAIRYLSATFVNNQGRAVGDKVGDVEVNISIPTKTGNWELKNYSDSFGEKTDDNYLILMGKGVFSNSATLNSNLTAILFVDNDSYSFRLFEYGSSPVKDDDASYVTLIKDSEGVIHSMDLTNSGQSAQIRPYSWQNNYIDFIRILRKGGDIIVTMSYNKYGKSDYRFILNVDGFNEAIKYVR